MSELRILANVGDVKISWNSNNEKEVSTARETFDKKMKEGWAAFAEKNGLKGDRLRIFDPDAQRIVLVPPISGG